MKHYIIGFGTKISAQRIYMASWGVSKARGFRLLKRISRSWYQVAEDRSWSSSHQWIKEAGVTEIRIWLNCDHTPPHLPHLCTHSCLLFFSQWKTWLKWVSYQGGNAGVTQDTVFLPSLLCTFNKAPCGGLTSLACSQYLWQESWGWTFT